MYNSFWIFDYFGRGRIGTDIIATKLSAAVVYTYRMNWGRVCNKGNHKSDLFPCIEESEIR